MIRRFRPWCHVTASASGAWLPMLEFESARWLWERLDGLGPHAPRLKNLLPDHTHLLAPGDVRTIDAIRRTLRWHTRMFGSDGHSWRLDVQTVSTRSILWRAAAYVLVNPVKDGLTNDPYSWLWSSARDLAGCSTRDAVGLHDLARGLGVHPARVAGELHRRVVAHTTFRAADPGLPCLPSAYRPSGRLADVVDAVLASERCDLTDLRRKGPPRDGVVALADLVGTIPSAELAEFVGVHRRTLAKMRSRERPDLRGALVCLANPRLRPPSSAPEGPTFGPSDPLDHGPETPKGGKWALADVWAQWRGRAK